MERYTVEVFEAAAHRRKFKMREYDTYPDGYVELAFGMVREDNRIYNLFWNQKGLCFVRLPGEQYECMPKYNLKLRKTAARLAAGSGQ